MRPRRRQTRRRRGLMLTDAVLGIVLLAMVAALLATTLAQHTAANERLASSRAATRFAERVVADLQLGQTPGIDAQSRYDVTPLEAPAPRGHVWVEVRVTHRGREATMIAVVPASSAAARKEGP